MPRLNQRQSIELSEFRSFDLNFLPMRESGSLESHLLLRNLLRHRLLMLVLDLKG